MADERRVPAETVGAQIEAVLTAWGMPAEQIAVTAGHMVETDLRGIDSHGISMLIMYEQQQQAGQLRLDAVPRILRESRTTALIDGGAGLGHPAADMAMRLAIDKALACDVGIVSVRNSHHFGACGTYASMATEKGLIAIVSTTSKNVMVVPTRGSQRVLGTNPFCFAAPLAEGPPIMIDMSTSVLAANKVKAYAYQGKPLPPGWVLDARGEPVTDSQEAYRQLFESQVGGLTAIGGAGTDLGGHKGYGLGVFAQVLSGALGGGSFSPIRILAQQAGDPDNIGHFFMALSPEAFRTRDEFQADLDQLVATLRNTRPIDPDQPVLIPGDPEWRERERRLALGIPLPKPLLDKIAEIAAGAGAPFLLERSR